MQAMSPVAAELYLMIQRFLYHEAALLDQRRYLEWLGLLTEDVNYRVTAPITRDAAAPMTYTIVDEGWVDLKARIDQLSNPRLTRAENPPTLVRRMIGDIEALQSDTMADITVTSYVMAYRGPRPGNPASGFYIAAREDRLCRDGNSFRIARRRIDLDHTILEGGTLTTLL